MLKSSYILFLIVSFMRSSTAEICDCADSIVMKCNGKGSLVVQAVIDKIESLNYFNSDDSSANIFVRSVAYVQTRDGTIGNQKGGIWAMTQAKLDIVSTSVNRPELRDKLKLKCVKKIGELFNESSMNIPLYSGLAARLYLETFLPIEHLSTISTQAHVWASKFNTEPNLTVSYFERIVSGDDLEHRKALMGVGSDVVEAVIDLLESWNIFTNDHCLMRRIALVETTNGLQGTQCGGIWAMNRTKINAIKQEEKWDEKTTKKLCFDAGMVINVQSMNKPLYSGLAARLFLEQSKNFWSFNDTISAQAQFWHNHYHHQCIHEESLTIEDFERLVGGESVDNTTKEYASGLDVVQAVLTRLDSSNIFGPDHRFMRRLAYVETRYGTKYRTFNSRKRGGIWGMDFCNLDDLRQTSKNHSAAVQGMLANITGNIKRVFGIDTWFLADDKMKIPLYNCLAARLYLYYVSITHDENIPLAGKIQEQADFWVGHYHSGTKQSQYFVDHASMAEDEEGKAVYIENPPEYCAKTLCVACAVKLYEV